MGVCPKGVAECNTGNVRGSSPRRPAIFLYMMKNFFEPTTCESGKLARGSSPKRVRNR